MRGFGGSSVPRGPVTATGVRYAPMKTLPTALKGMLAAAARALYCAVTSAT